MKTALLNVVQGPVLRGAAQKEAALAMRAKQDGAAVSQLLKRYKDKYDSPDVVANLEPGITTHPVYVKIQKFIARLEDGTPEGETSSKFAYSLISEMTATLTLINKAGMTS